MNEYKKGYLQALRDYAWWRDGVQYVGCGARTLEQAEREVIRTCGKQGCQNLSNGEPILGGGIAYYTCDEHRAEIEELVDGE